MSTENSTSWTDTKAKARVIRGAAGTQRTPAQEAAALEHVRAEVRAYRLAEVRRDSSLNLC